jgi:hypothetical protein
MTRERERERDRERELAQCFLGSGSDVNGKKRLLFFTVHPGDSYHGYNSIFGACQLLVEYKEHALRATGRQTGDTHGD